eukprot:Em0001g2617a
MDRARDDYTREERSKLEELERNKRRQRELEDELRMLKARENQLRDEVAEGKELQQKVDESQELANIDEWKASIAQLQNKTSTSLKIMDLMDECTQAIMSDALKRKWMSSLQPALSTWGVDDCKMNLDQIKTSVQEKEAETKAAQTGFARKVNDLTRDLDNCHQDRLMYEMKWDMHSSELEALTTKLKSIDSDVAALRPQLELDSLKERYTRFKQAKVQAFEKLNGVLDYSSVSACGKDDVTPQNADTLEGMLK